jgi:hypothetical protein
MAIPTSRSVNFSLNIHYNIDSESIRYPRQLFNSLTFFHSSTNLIFLGDSVSSQFFHFLSCDLAQSPLDPFDQLSTHGIQWVNRTCQFCTAYIDFWKAQGNSSQRRNNTLRIYNRQFNLPCLYDYKLECGVEEKEREELVYHYTTQLLSHFLDLPGTHNSFSEQTIIVFNYGLHIPDEATAHWALHGMVRGIISTIDRTHQEKRNIFFFFRETSSQVFGLSSG